MSKKMTYKDIQRLEVEQGINGGGKTKRKKKKEIKTNF